MRRTVFAAALLAASAPHAAGDLIFSEDFETDGAGSRYQLSTPEFSDFGGVTYFTRTEGEARDFSYGNRDGFFFGGRDVDSGRDRVDPLQTVTFSGIDVTGRSGLQFEGLFAESGGAGEWDAADFLRVDYRLDGGGYRGLLWFQTDAGGAARHDADFDGVGDAPTHWPPTSRGTPPRSARPAACWTCGSRSG